MTITATELRANIYRLLDTVLASGVPLEVERSGRKLVIQAVGAPASPLDRISAIAPRDWIVGDADSLNAEWSWGEPALVADATAAASAKKSGRAVTYAKTPRKTGRASK